MSPRVDPRSFFRTPQPAAYLKHQILRGYLKPFASKTGSASMGHRVVYIDGYAGPGKYQDGTPGSPAIAVETARSLQPRRNLACVFVEQHRDLFDDLRGYVDSAGSGLDCRCLHGDVAEHLPVALEVAGRSPVFAFMDPFGRGLPFEKLAGDMLGRSRSRSVAAPKTELLLNLSADDLRRVGGLLRVQAPTPRNLTTLDRQDMTLGGSWWRDLYLEGGTGWRSLLVIAQEYWRRLADEAGGGWGGLVVPVADSLAAEPAYFLLHFSRHPDGAWLFYEATALGRRRWREHCTERESHGQMTLDGLVEAFEEDEAAWEAEIRHNALQLLQDGPVAVQQQLPCLLGRAMGLAYSPHIKRVVKRMYACGETSTDGKGDVQGMVISPPVRPR